MPFFVMVLVIVFAWSGFSAVDDFFQRRKKREHDLRYEMALDAFYGTQEILIRKEDDCGMYYDRWREMLPFCEFADAVYREICGPLAERNSCRAFVIRKMEGREEEDTLV